PPAVIGREHVPIAAQERPRTRTVYLSNETAVAHLPYRQAIGRLMGGDKLIPVFGDLERCYWVGRGRDQPIRVALLQRRRRGKWRAFASVDGAHLSPEHVASHRVQQE